MGTWLMRVIIEASCPWSLVYCTYKMQLCMMKVRIPGTWYQVVSIPATHIYRTEKVHKRYTGLTCINTSDLPVYTLTRKKE